MPHADTSAHPSPTEIRRNIKKKETVLRNADLRILVLCGEAVRNCSHKTDEKRVDHWEVMIILGSNSTTMKTQTGKNEVDDDQLVELLPKSSLPAKCSLKYHHPSASSISEITQSTPVTVLVQPSWTAYVVSDGIFAERQHNETGQRQW